MAAFQHSRGPHAGRFEVTGRIVDVRPLAIRLDDGVATVWLPKRFIQTEDIGKGFVNVFMPAWLAREKGYA